MERLGADAQSEFDAMVEAVRVGTIFGQNQKAYDRWRSRRRRSGESVGLTGAALETAVMSLALTHSEYVVEGPR